TPLGDDVDQVVNERSSRLPILVVALVTPGVVHGHAGFPVAVLKAGRRDELLGGLGVAVVAASQAVVGEEPWPKGSELVKRLGAIGVHPLRRIPPEDVGPKTSENLAHLGHGDLLQVIVEASLMSFVPAIPLLVAAFAAAGMVPILGLRIVQ